ncbi:MAG: cupin domain-containing protein [Candidatus Zixiibacteriota bacterium]|nr:MAG: cupin domain-containing protein [candidate division Zixibacteria bacterium]
MKELMTKWEGTTFPEWIRGLPEIDVPFDGVRGWLLQAGAKQVVFFDIQPVGAVPAHSHGAQWGIVVEGEMELTIGDETKIYRSGDWYYIPEGVMHSANFLTRVSVIDVFSEPDRWKAKQ